MSRYDRALGRASTRKVKELDAVERARELRELPFDELPKLLVDYAMFRGRADDYYTSTPGILKTMAHYAQIVEGRPCDDEEQKPDSAAVAWFAERVQRMSPKSYTCGTCTHYEIVIDSQGIGECHNGKCNLSVPVSLGAGYVCKPEFWKSRERPRGATFNNCRIVL